MDPAHAMYHGLLYLLHVFKNLHKLSFWQGQGYLLLRKLGLYKFKTKQVYAWFIGGKISETELYEMLLLNQVPEFTALHQALMRDYDRWAATAEPRIAQKRWAKLMQVDRMVDRGLEEGITRAKGKVNIIHREH